MRSPGRLVGVRLYRRLAARDEVPDRSRPAVRRRRSGRGDGGPRDVRRQDAARAGGRRHRRLRGRRWPALQDRRARRLLVHEPRRQGIDHRPQSDQDGRRRRRSTRKVTSHDRADFRRQRRLGVALRRELRRTRDVRRLQARGHVVQGEGRRVVDDEGPLQARRREHPPRRWRLQGLLEPLRQGS